MPAICPPWRGVTRGVGIGEGGALGAWGSENQGCANQTTRVPRAFICVHRACMRSRRCLVNMRTRNALLNVLSEWNRKVVFTFCAVRLVTRLALWRCRAVTVFSYGSGNGCHTVHYIRYIQLLPYRRHGLVHEPPRAGLLTWLHRTRSWPTCSQNPAIERAHTPAQHW